MPEPRDADARAERKTGRPGAEAVDDADDLVTRDERHAARWQVSFDDVKVRPTDRSHRDSHAQLARPRHGLWQIDGAKRSMLDGSLRLEKHRAHGDLFFTA